jgi:hypothetical protein
MRMSLPILALLAVMLTACSEFQQFTAELQPAGFRGGECGINCVMMDVHATRTMGKEQLQETLKRWEQEYQDNPSDSNRLRLALLYATSDQSVRDNDRAQKLLTEAVDLPGDPGEREFAAVLRQLLDEQTDAYRKINLLNKQTAELNKRIVELERQQRALTNIEQKIQQRETPAVIDDGK